MMIVLWLIPAGFLAAWFLARRHARRLVVTAATWPHVTGHVVDASVRQANGNGTYTPEVSYIYSVDGQAYASDRLRPGGTPFFYSESRAIALVRGYAPGAPITVYHHPTKPKRAAIELAVQSHAQFLFAVLTIATGAIVILVSVG